LIGIYETRVPEPLFDSISSTLLRGWKWTANYDYSPRGRIWVGWDPNVVAFDPLSSNVQAIHGYLTFNISSMSCYISAVYGDHTFVQRRPLWDDLIHYNEVLQDSSWLVAGDFNAIRDPSDRVGGSNSWIPNLMSFSDA